MKKLYTISVVVLMIAITSCKKDDNGSPSNSIDNTMQQGKWRVTNYIDSGNNETNHYTSYEFQFNSNGIVTATKSGSTVSGTWTSGVDDSQQKLILFFSTAPFDELSDDWHIVSQNSLVINLEDVSGGNGGTDYLTFSKI